MQKFTIKKNYRFKRFFVLLAIFILSFKLHAQTATVSGQVTTTTGIVQGASVIVDGKGVFTDANGNYNLSILAGNHTIVASYVGFQKQSQQINAVAGQMLTLNFLLQSADNLSDVTVVGIRNPKRSATESPVPIDVISLKQVINQVGQLDLTQLLTYLAPSFNSVRQALGDATDQTDPAQLRGLGPDQVLVLVNGKRYHQTSLVNVNGTVNKGTTGTDLNSIPASAIDHIEILRDGAAAQYGSDAIAGVVNLVLKKKQGFSLSASFGENVSSYDKNYAWNKINPSSSLPNHVNVHDGQNYQVGASYGFNLKKGYLNISGEFLRRNKSNRTGLYTGPIWSSSGTVATDDPIDQQKGVDRSKYDLRVGNSQISGGGGVLNFAYPVSKNLEVYAVGLVNLKSGISGGLYRYPYKLASTANGGSFTTTTQYSGANAAAIVAQLYPFGFLPLENDKMHDYHFTAGIRGKLSNWNVDLSETYGYNSIQYGVSNSVNYTQAYLPNIAANDLQTVFNAGKTKTYQATTNLDISKNFPVLQGLNIAGGAEFRVDGYGINAGEPNSYLDLTGKDSLIGIAGAQVFSGFLPSNAGSWNRNNIAVYTDNELDITKNFLVTAAVRYEHYSDFGGTFNYKFSARYKLTDWLALRASTSSGFRAPSLAQEHYSKVNTLFVQDPNSTSGGLVPVQAGTFPNNSKIAKALGIPKLKQETSHSYSVGATANITRGLDLTVDAYQIDIKNRIILSNSFSNSNAAIKPLLTAAGAGSASVFANAIDTRSRGIEGVLSYTKNFRENNSLNISLAHSTNVNKVKRDDNGNLIIHASSILSNAGLTSSYFNRADESRIETYTPKNKDILTIQYRYKKFGVLARVSYFGSVQYWADSTGGKNFGANAFDGGKVDTEDQIFGGKFLSDLSLSYFINKNIAINVGANNLFNVYPDKIFNSGNANSGTFVYSRSVSQFGFNGRYVFAKLNINF
ncbi:MAG: TonB-dependent receptor [Arachidicoccus sp.]|nr:TonB-dependent receptor [Arachidicoccus sp.]